MTKYRTRALKRGRLPPGRMFCSFRKSNLRPAHSARTQPRRSPRAARSPLSASTLPGHLCGQLSQGDPGKMDPPPRGARMEPSTAASKRHGEGRRLVSKGHGPHSPVPRSHTGAGVGPRSCTALCGLRCSPPAPAAGHGDLRSSGADLGGGHRLDGRALCPSFFSLQDVRPGQAAAGSACTGPPGARGPHPEASTHRLTGRHPGDTEGGGLLSVSTWSVMHKGSQETVSSGPESISKPRQGFPGMLPWAPRVGLLAVPQHNAVTSSLWL